MYEDKDGRWGEVRRLVRFSISAQPWLMKFIVVNGLSKFLCTVWYRLVTHVPLPLLYPYLRLLNYPVLE